MTTTLSDPLPLEQVFNFRDLGGHTAADGRTVRRGRVYRADGLHRLVPGDADLLAPLGLRTVIDLRTDGEVAEWGHAPTAVVAVDVHHHSLLRSTWDPADVVIDADCADAAAFLTARYLDMLEEGAPALVATVGLIADRERHGVVFHCAAGKDRTGVVAALVLGLLGVADTDVAQDYARTAPAIPRLEQWYRANHPDRVEIVDRQPRAFAACPPAAMVGFLAEVRRRWGSIDACVRDLGVPADTIDELRTELLT